MNTGLWKWILGDGKEYWTLEIKSGLCKRTLEMNTGRWKLILDYGNA